MRETKRWVSGRSSGGWQYRLIDALRREFEGEVDDPDGRRWNTWPVLGLGYALHQVRTKTSVIQLLELPMCPSGRGRETVLLVVALCLPYESAAR